MERLNQLLHMQEYMEAVEKIEKFEETRIYCGHGMEHFRDVARIAYMIALEEQSGFQKELIYVTAFLHDMGRAYEYEGHCSHESGSVVLALNWLPKCGFSEEEIAMAVEAIQTHRDREKVTKHTLGDILYRADKLSRDCFTCKAIDSCKWAEEEKNMKIVY